MKEYQDYSFDNQLAQIEGIHYTPWVGRNFQAQTNRMLILAESVYEGDWDGTNDSTFVRDGVVPEHGLQHLNGNGGDKKMFRNIERAIFGSQEVAHENREKLWTSAAFSQFVQQAMPGRETRPTDAQYQQGAKVLKSLCGVLEVNTVLVLGTEWAKIAAICGAFAVEAPAAEKIGRYKARTFSATNAGGKPVTFICIKHPSAYFSWHLWHEYIHGNLTAPFLAP